MSSVTLNGERQTGYSDMEIGRRPSSIRMRRSPTFGFDFVMPTGTGCGLSEGAGFELPRDGERMGTSYLQTQFKLELPKTNTWDDKIGLPGVCGT